MPPRIAVTIILVLAIAPARADDLLCRYEGDALPQKETPGWQNGDPCDPPCQETVENGFLVHYWPTPGNRVGYYYWLARPPILAPQRLWVEWAFRSNHAIGRYSYTCDGWFSIQYAGLQDLVYMYGDAAISIEGGDYVLGLDVNEFHTYRFESLNGFDYRISIDGLVFISDSQNQPYVSSILQFAGNGGCIGDSIPDLVNEWDFVRFGTIDYGEQIVTPNPPDGFVDARQYAPLDRFTITFDSPNYVYINDVTVAVSHEATEPRSHEGTEGTSFDLRYSPFDIPVVVATRRLNNGPADVVEIVLDRPIPYNATTRFTFNDGALSQTLDYTYAPGDTNGDGAATLSDFAAFQSCFGVQPLVGACLALDADANSAIDLFDFAAFERVFTAP